MLDHTYWDEEQTIPAGFCIAVLYDKLAYNLKDAGKAKAIAREYVEIFQKSLRLPEDGEVAAPHKNGNIFESEAEHQDYACYIKAKEEEKRSEWAKESVEGMKRKFQIAHTMTVSQLDQKSAGRGRVG